LTGVSPQGENCANLRRRRGITKGRGDATPKEKKDFGLRTERGKEKRSRPSLARRHYGKPERSDVLLGHPELVIKKRDRTERTLEVESTEKASGEQIEKERLRRRTSPSQRSRPT